MVGPLGTVVHQIIPNFYSGDASSLAALHLQRLLRCLGHAGEIFALEVAPGMTSLVKPVSLLRALADDWVLYHHGIASPLSGRILHLRCRRGVVYHNITPARWYPRSPLRESLVAGRAQLKAMADHLDVAIADSRFNAQELIANGYQNVHVVPLFVEPERFGVDQADPATLTQLRRGGTTILSVGRIMPHKRFEDVLCLHAELLRLRPGARLVIAGEYQPGDAYFRSLRKAARGLKNVEFLGKVSHPELVAAYRAASLYVSMSEHEGFGVPLIEAMAAGVPIMAFGAGAVRETMNDSGVVFSEKQFAFLAELASELIAPSALRKAVLRAQQRRLQAFSASRVLPCLRSAIPPRRSTRRAVRNRRRVALIVQRYGEVLGGAEIHARQVANRLSRKWEITVLTTCSRDHLRWDNDFPAGSHREQRVEVQRFPCQRPRDLRSFNMLSRTLFDRPTDYGEEQRWLAEQGPYVPDLFRHLDKHRDDFEAFIFFTYLYTSTVWGVPLVGGRAILVPTAHDEPPLRFGVYQEVFALPSVLLCNTPEERELIHRRFPRHARTRLAGVGIDTSPGTPSRFRKRFHLTLPYLMYVGRIESGKGIPELLRCYAELRRCVAEPPELVLAGAGSMRIDQRGVRYIGPISERDKLDGIAGAFAVVVPSRYESLSLLALEAFSQATPVLANGESEVLKGQVDRSRAGFTYRDPGSFVRGYRQIDAERRVLGRRGLAYARRHSWKRVLEVYDEELTRIARDHR